MKMNFSKINIVRASIIIVLTVAMSFLMQGVAKTSESQGDLRKELEGAWQGDGKTQNMQARLSLKWDWVLGNKFLRLTLRNQMTAPNGARLVFEGLAYYHAVGEGKYEATWFDSRGLTFPIKAAADANALVAFWGSPETEQGKSTYRLIEPGRLEVIDEVRQKDGTYKEFARFSLRRE